MADELQPPESWTPSAWRVLLAAMGKPPERRNMAESRCFTYFAERRPWKPVETVWDVTDEASEPSAQAPKKRPCKGQMNHG